MKIIEKKQKRTYVKPQVERIELDNEVSMVMMSPPIDKDESMTSSDNFSINPFK